MIQPGVSIIVCCHNGAARLPQTVRHLAEQVVPASIQWEFILVDNQSTDNSVALTQEIWDSYSPGGALRIVSESKLGLSFARARGFAEAKYEYVIMCDDDNWLMPDYVALSFEIMHKNSKIGALGGVGKILFEEQPEPWLQGIKIFAAGEQSHRSGKVESCRIYGAGCVVRKSAYVRLKALGFKTRLTDRKGNELSSGGDHELCYALSIMGYDIWYDSRLKFFHFITKERLTWNYCLRYAKESTACFSALTSYKMIALNLNTHKFSYIVLARDFFYCLRKFARVNAERIIKRRNVNESRRLYFRHVILKTKLVSYLFKFGAMARNHREILKFKEACDSAKSPARAVRSVNDLISSFSSRPSRQPQ